MLMTSVLLKLRGRYAVDADVFTRGMAGGILRFHLKHENVKRVIPRFPTKTKEKAFQNI